MSEEKICRFCHNTNGRIFFNDNNYSNHVCQICNTKITDKWLESINNLNPEYAKFSFDSFDITKINQKQVDVCKDFSLCKTDRDCLLLYSENAGNGKTHLAISTLKLWIKNCDIFVVLKYGFTDIPFEIVTEPSIFLEIRKTFQQGYGNDEATIIEKYAKTPMLLIDDVGKYNPSDLSFVQRVMFSIIDERYLNHRKTILTANKSGSNLRQYLGDYTFDRLCGMTGNRITGIFGESYRQNKNGKVSQ